MSDSWIEVIPTHPTFVPSDAASQAAVQFLNGIAPEAQTILGVDEGSVVFIDAGTNFDSIHCCYCQAPIEIDWWRQRMEEAWNSKFTDLTIETPCCNAITSLNDLDYNWPQGFARWHISVMNPRIKELTLEQTMQLAELIGHGVRIVYTHL